MKNNVLFILLFTSTFIFSQHINCVKEDLDTMFEKALEHGTDETTNKYKKDTPGQ